MELRDRQAILVDVETTGFNNKEHQLLQVGILILNQGEIQARFEVNIKHKQYTISIQALKANKIDLVKHDEKALDIKDAAQQILEFLKQNKVDKERYLVIGQNVQFDIGFLDELFLKAFKIKEYKELVGYRTLDIMQLALIRNIEGKLNLTELKLDSILNALRIEKDEELRHTALGDCLLEYEVLKKLLY